MMNKEMSLKSAGIITIAVLLGIMLLSGMRYGEVVENSTTVDYESPIEKNAKVALKPGERYVYLYGFNETNLSSSIEFDIENGVNCTELVMVSGNSIKSVCIDEWGTDESSSNETLSEPEIFFFSPWMLALRENWDWEVTTRISIGGQEKNVWTREYRVMRTDIYEGRNAYVVELTVDGDPYEYLWIDSEKRIILKAVGSSYVVKLVNGTGELFDN